MQVSGGNLVLHLSEHHGDGSPGANIRVEMIESKTSIAKSRPRITVTSVPASS